jgi:uncharacterized protein YjbI with pentapeptide repeats
MSPTRRRLPKEAVMGLWKHLPIVATMALLALVILIIAIPPASGRDWPPWTGLQGKTIWDLAQLVIVPLSLALIAYMFSNKQRLEDREIARAQREQDLRIADERRRNDSEIALNREREDALQAYLSAMTALLLDHDMNDQKVAVIAQARTLTLLPRMDGNRKATVLRFLAGANLISAEKPVLSLNGADFSAMQAGPLSLWGVSLNGANLRDCKLARSSIRNSDLRWAILVDTDLTDADLFGSDFGCASLAGTDFSQAILLKADFSKGFPARASMHAKQARDNARRSKDLWLETLTEARFQSAKYDYSTKWPDGFDPKRAGLVDIGD